MLFVVICVLFLAEAVSIPPAGSFVKVPRDAGARFAWLADKPEVKNILYLPMKYEEVDITYASRWHGKQMVNGYSGYFPPLYNWFKEHQNVFPHPAYIRAMQAFEVDHVVMEGGLFKHKGEAVLDNPDLEVVAREQGLVLIRVRQKKIKLDRQAVLAGQVDRLWRFGPSDLENYALSIRAEPHQDGPLASATVTVQNNSKDSLPDGVLQFWARVDAPGGWREALIRMPGLKPGQKKDMDVGALLPWPKEQEVQIRVHLRIENKLYGPEVSVRTMLGPSGTVKVLEVRAYPEPQLADNIIDGDIITRWTTNRIWKPDEYIRLKLDAKPLKGVYLLNHDESLGDHPKGMEVFTSKDGEKWTLLKKIDPLKVHNYTGLETVWLDLRGVKEPYLRLVPANHNPHRWWSLHELLVIKE